ncbi:M18 family aminopeptidase [Actinomyces minihominis]|uniref:M18 family aminopeptidase n=1 Tax=Actinomyces minihominis TaxID=2002838 RepID=UPI000C07BAA7|nr:M18 family aminopeptidase [Actinomyces minihominis]
MSNSLSNSEVEEKSALTPASPEVIDYAADYADFILSSPTSYHAADQGAQLLTESGFTEVDRKGEWPTAAGRYFLVEDGALVAWVQDPRSHGFAITATHSDSPALKLKPIPQRTTADGWGQLMVEVYGGPLNNAWLDRELQVAGAVVDWDGNRRLIHTGPIAFIPQLAPHLDRGVNAEGVKLDPQRHMQPVWTIGEERDVMAVIADLAGFDSAADIAASELFLVPTQAPEVFGVDNQFFAAGRQDNLSSSFAGFHALTKLVAELNEDEALPRIPVLAMFDHEEIGSGTPTGARGPLLEEVLERISLALGLDGDARAQALATSTLLSADAAHSVNPGYEDKHGPETRPVMGKGPALKMDADQSYATSLGGVATWRKACRDAGVPTQVFVSHSSMRAGSTVGPLLATRLGIETVDVGIPILSMHSTREISHVVDPVYLSSAIRAFWLG